MLRKIENSKKIVSVLTLAGLMAGRLPVLADDTADQIKALRDEITALDQKVRILERQKQVDAEVTEAATAAKAKDTPKLAVGNTGLTVSSADTNFVVGLHGIIQVDHRNFFNDNGIQGNDGFFLRRARPILSGTLYKDFDFMFVPDFGGSTVQIFDAYANYR